MRGIYRMQSYDFSGKKPCHGPHTHTICKKIVPGHIWPKDGFRVMKEVF